MPTKKIAQILLPTPFDEGFSYFVPEDLNLNIGNIVKVPFRSNEIYGVVIGFKDDVDFDKSKIKTIISLEEKLSLSSKLLEFIDFVASYNLIPKGLVVKLSLAILNSSSKRISNSQKKSKQKPSEKSPEIKLNLKPLNQIQEKAAEILKNKINDNFSVSLIDGVTGSGKTEVYFRAIADSLKTDSQVLILLPEIALTSQLCERFKSQFGFDPELWHSKIGSSKKRKLFFKIAQGSCKVLIGARSSLFLPFKNLKLIIIDEEHDASFKQEDIAIYNARDMAIMRAKIENIPIILSSATPSLETYINAASGKYELIKLEQRFSSSEKTEIKLVDLKKEKLSKDQFISNLLKNLLEENLKHNRQSLLFLNRRGYAPLTLCNKCGSKISCKNCSSYLTYHQKIHRLTCHHCGYSSKMSNICPSCREENSLVNCGVGIEKLAEEVKKYFPQSRIGFMTSDHVKTNTEAKQLIEKILNHEIDIIIGTQMIAKGHHFPSLALVGVIDADGSFLSGNLRTLERSFQLLTQVIGRAGREHYQGTVVLQTYNSENLVFKKIIEDKRDEFLNDEIKARQMMNFPPFSKMATIVFSAKNENLLIDFAGFVLKKFPLQNKDLELFGPAPLPITRLKGNYQYGLHIKVAKKINLQKLIKETLNLVKIPSQIRVKVDIDPL